MVLVCAALVTACTSSDSPRLRPAPSTAATQPTVTTAAPHQQVATVSGAVVPSWPAPMVSVPGQVALDRAAGAYSTIADERDAVLFLASYLAQTRFDALVARTPTRVESAIALGEAWTAGLHGGWLVARHGAVALGAGPVPGTTRTSFSALARWAGGVARVSSGSSANLVATVTDVLGGIRFGSTGVPPWSAGAARSFGLTQGFVTGLLAAPPAGFDTIDEYRVSCREVVVCEYATDHTNTLLELQAAVQPLLATDRGRSAVAGIAADVALGVSTGRAVAQDLLQHAGWDVAEIERLLVAATVHLDIDHAALLLALRAEATADTRDARTALRALAFAAELDGAWMLGASSATPPVEPELHFD